MGLYCGRRKNSRSLSYLLLGCQKWLVPVAILALTCCREEIAAGRIRGEGKIGSWLMG